MGIKHADRIDDALRQRLREHPDLDDFFDEDHARAVLRQEPRARPGRRARRDHPHRSATARAPTAACSTASARCNDEGGERRLNVAVTRAKPPHDARLVLHAADMDPDRTKRRGVRTAARSTSATPSRAATNLGRRRAETARAQPVRDRRPRRARHAPASRSISQYGVAATASTSPPSTPTSPAGSSSRSRADGASYHSSETARDRDRLRQEQLERLGWRFHRIWSTRLVHRPASARSTRRGRLPRRRH